MSNGSKKNGEPGWSWRRAAIFPVVIWGCWQLDQLKYAPDTEVNGTLAYGWMTLIGVLIVGYTGFATAQDVVAIWRLRTGRPYAEPEPQPYQPQPYPQAPEPQYQPQAGAYPQ